MGQPTFPIMQEIKNNLAGARKSLDEFLGHDENLENVLKAGTVMVNALKNGNKILSCGNGGSMCDAMHFAEEMTGLFRGERPALAAIAISDPGHITCAANDYGFESIFSRYVEGVGRSGDVLLAISTSGNSENVLRAAEAAKNAGMTVVGLTGRDGGKLAGLCDVEVRGPDAQYSDRIQEIHGIVIHCLIDYVERKLTNI